SSSAPSSPPLYTLSLHDALPIYAHTSVAELERIANDTGVDEIVRHHAQAAANSLRETPADVKAAELERLAVEALRRVKEQTKTRSEEHTSELQSRFDLVCRLLLE